MSFAGVSLIGGDGGDASRSAWDTAADTSDSGYHLLVVRGYSRTEDTPNGECIKSQQFRVGGYRWHIGYYPNGRLDRHRDYISFYLCLDDNLVGDQHVTFQFEFSFIDQVGMQEPSRIRAMQSCKISGKSFSWGYPCFVRRSILEGSKHLKNDTFAVRCDIVVVTANANAERSSSAAVPPPLGIQQHLGSLLLSGEGADVTFEVGGETFMAHRCVLAARSRVFRAELFGPMKEGTTRSVIRIDDMEPQVFRLLLSFIYSDSVPHDYISGGHDYINGGGRDGRDNGPDDDDEMILWQNLLVAAGIYDLQKLKLVCEENLYRYIEATTVASILALAELQSGQGLKDACSDFCGRKKS